MLTRRLAREYNRRFNAIVLRDYSTDGERLTLPGLARNSIVMANEVTAHYYGLNCDSGFRFVPITHGRRDLGGLLTQPAILAGLSDGKHTLKVSPDSS